MPLSAHSSRITAGQSAAELLVQLVDLSLDCSSEADFLAKALDCVNQKASSTGTTLIEGAKGQWRVIAHAGAGDGLPTEMLAEALDAESCKQGEGWTAAPLHKPNRASQLLASNSESIDPGEFDSWSAAVGLALNLFKQRDQQSRRAQRLDAILEMTAGWNQSRQTDDLLEQIALTSTRLLGAERATIFLPDAAGSSLIGKPALGVEAGEIRIPVSAGVVGQVMQSGQPARVDYDVSAEQSQIHREVDDQLGFQTKTILCVPMVNGEGKTIGAFELINRNEGNFTDEDETALCELAAHAANSHLSLIHI